MALGLFSVPAGQPVGEHMDYRLPRPVRDRLAAAVAGRRNRDACMALALFIARFWTAPRKLGLPFILDRRALAPVAALGLTEARIRGAIRTLERAGFLDRAVTGGRTHQRTPDGLHRKPIAFQIAADYRDMFAKPNARAAAARGRRSGSGPIQTATTSARLPTARAALSGDTKPNGPNSPKWKLEPKIHLGENRSPSPAGEPNPSLEAALDRWRRAFEDEGSASRTGSA